MSSGLQFEGVSENIPVLMFQAEDYLIGAGRGSNVAGRG